MGMIESLKRFEWKYKNLILLIISILIAYLILKFQYTHEFITGLGSFGYLGSFLAGMLFSYGLTAVPATATIFLLAENLNPVFIALLGAAGAVVSDYLIFRFVRDRLMKEIELVSTELHIRISTKLSRSKFLSRLTPIIAGFIIASPLPDELGVALFGAVNYEPKKFVVYCYCFNFIGILLIALLGHPF